MVFSLHLVRALSATACLAALGAVAACSGDDVPGRSASFTTTSTTSATPQPFAVTGAGLPAELLTVMTAVYEGGTVPATGTVTSALAQRRPLGAPVKVTGQVKKWKGTPIASVVSGKDVTLLVKERSWQVVGGWWPSLGLPNRTPTRTARILAIGSDARRSQTPGKLRADALHIIGVDPKGVGGIVGIPRDSYVSLSTGGHDKINAAMVFGGPKAQVATVRNATGVPIDGYVMTGFKGFEEMVDLIGPLLYTSPSALTSHVGQPLLKKGLNKLKGLTALNFARERKHVSGGDFGRSANQGKLIIAGIRMAQDAGPARLPTYLQAMGQWLESDLTASEVLNLASTIYLTHASSITNVVAKGGFGTRNGQSVVLLGSSAQAKFDDLLDGRLGG